MRPINTVLSTLLVMSLSSAAYARVPARDAAGIPGELMPGHGAALAALQDQAKPPEKAPEMKPPKAGEKPPRAEKAEKPSKQDKKADKQQQKQEKEQAKHGAKQDHPAGKSARIPPDKFKAHFGRPHSFTVKRVITTTRIVPNQTRFVYSGYTFVFLDPWPAGWLLTDDCYIDEVDDEYFLFDAFHPGIRVALSFGD